jgi:hypothetical protein
MKNRCENNMLCLIIKENNYSLLRRPGNKGAEEQLYEGDTTLRRG